MRGKAFQAKKSREHASWFVSSAIATALIQIDGKEEGARIMRLSLWQVARLVVKYALQKRTTDDGDAATIDPLAKFVAQIREECDAVVASAVLRQ